MKSPVLLSILLISVLFVSGCTAPEAPVAPSVPSADYLDGLGCFPKGCDLPPGMKELCQAFEAGSISWPADCMDFRDVPCQQLCEREKNRPVEPVTFIVEVPANTPMEDIDVHVQLIPSPEDNQYQYFFQRMTQMEDGRWTVGLPISNEGEIRYRYFRNDFGEAVQEELPGDLEGYRVAQVSAGDTVEDIVSGWRWYPHVGEELPTAPPSIAGQKAIAPRVSGIPFMRGYLYYDFWWDSCDRFVQPTDESMKASNGNWVGIWPPWDYMETDPLPVVGYEGYGHVYSPQELEFHISQVQKDGLNIWLGPQICCHNPYGDTDHSDEWWSAWFDEIDKFSIYNAETAEKYGIEYLTLFDEGLIWRSTDAPADVKERYDAHIAKVREIYSGKLGMAYTTGPSYTSPSDMFPGEDQEWIFDPGQFDFFSVAIWTQVAANKDPTVDELEANFRKIFDQGIKPLHEKWGKPIIIVPAYTSTDGGLSQEVAWNAEGVQIWDPYSDTYQLDLGEQALAYEAILRVVADMDYVIGFYPFVYGYTDLPKSKDWTIRGKPAEQVVSGWYESFA